MTGRAYPLPRPDDDPRFTFGLTLDVAKVLAEHGYPTLTSGRDHLELKMALFGFLYADGAAADDGGAEKDDDLAHLRAGAVAMLRAAERRAGTEADSDGRWTVQAGQLAAEIAGIDQALQPGGDR